MEIVFSLKTSFKHNLADGGEVAFKDHFREAVKKLTSAPNHSVGLIPFNNLQTGSLEAERGEFLTVMDQEFDVAVKESGSDRLCVTIYPKPEATYLKR